MTALVAILLFIMIGISFYLGIALLGPIGFVLALLFWTGCAILSMYVRLSLERYESLPPIDDKKISLGGRAKVNIQRPKTLDD